jgi:hypothetical protein
MPDWFPDPRWEGKPCYIIGGGPSLEGFCWERLAGEFVLGCNVAFYHGVDIVPVMLFGDAKFFSQHEEGLAAYAEAGGWVVTNSSRRGNNAPGWLRVMKKQLRGLALDGLGWNGNTGASAINLALLLGADPIYLLGFDMRVGANGKTNYHNAYNNRPNGKTYQRFRKGMERVAKDLARLFPGRRVINLDDGTSALDVFPKENLAEHFAEKEALCLA